MAARRCAAERRTIRAWVRGFVRVRFEVTREVAAGVWLGRAPWDALNLFASVGAGPSHTPAATSRDRSHAARDQTLGDARGERHDRHLRVHADAAREDAGVGDVESGRAEDLAVRSDGA